MVDCGMVGGKRPRFFFPTRAQAEGKAAALRVQRENEGARGLQFSAAERADARAALDILGPHRLTLTEAARFFVDHAGVLRSELTVEKLIADFLESKRGDGKSKRYLQDLDSRLRAFAAAPEFAGKSVAGITGEPVDAWLRGLGQSPVSRNNFRRVLNVLFAFAVRRGAALKNPVSDVPVATVKVEKPAILTAAESAALLRHAPPGLRPALALALFAGLRPEAEIFRLDWSAVNLGDRTIDVSDSKNTTSHRFVDIPDNLRAILTPLAKSSGKVAPEHWSYYQMLLAARKAAKLGDFPADVLRHTYASMHYALHKSAERTAEQLGHGSSTRMLHRHYRNRVKEAEARTFWSIGLQAEKAAAA